MAIANRRRQQQLLDDEPVVQAAWRGRLSVWEAADEDEPLPLGDDLWDVFELDEDSAEPEPAYGDFWACEDEED